MALSYNTMCREEDEPVFAAEDESEFLQVCLSIENTVHLLQQSAFLEGDDENIDHKKTKSDPRELIAGLYTEMRPQLYRYVKTLGISADQTREIIQETFVRLMAQLVSGEEIKNPRGWAVRVARNLAMSHHRKHGQRRKNAEDGEQEDEELAVNRVDPSLNQEEQFLQQEKMRTMRKALLGFNPRHRAIFMMRLQGFLYQDIAEVMNINEQRAAEIVKLVAGRLAVICG